MVGRTDLAPQPPAVLTYCADLLPPNRLLGTSDLRAAHSDTLRRRSERAEFHFEPPGLLHCRVERGSEPRSGGGRQHLGGGPGRRGVEKAHRHSKHTNLARLAEANPSEGDRKSTRL